MKSFIVQLRSLRSFLELKNATQICKGSYVVSNTEKTLERHELEMRKSS